MSWDLHVFAADEPPPSLSEMPDDWKGGMLGTLDEVRAKISRIFPKTDWSDPYWGDRQKPGRR